MQNILTQLEDILQKDLRLVANGRLLKNKITELIVQGDSELLTLLISQHDLKRYFFQQVGEVMVFDKNKFLHFIQSKTLLPDSYTAYKNQIGLATENHQYIAASDEVVLAWPYKDCMLEGGQTKEDTRVKEVFWNEILAPEAIDRLTEPKAFCHIKKYHPGGITENPSFDPQDNFIIKGNNLMAMHSLKPRFRESVKLIYIDPPYNTGSDSFGYNDSFRHSSWLTFMKNRLEIARELLRPDGVIFVHIGDEEMHYLKVLMDEIFGRDFFIGTIPRKTRSGKSDVPFRFSQDFDWILAYTKSASTQSRLFKRPVERKYYQSSDFPNDTWRLNPITTQRTIKERPNSDYTMINPKNGQQFPVNPNRSWAVTKDTFHTYYKAHKIVFPGDYDFLNISQPMLRVFKSEEVAQKGEDFDKTSFGSDTVNIQLEALLKNTKNKNGTDEMVSIFGHKAFAYPKNELLLKVLIESCTKEGDLVLDYHLGSGTTAAVAHKMKRRYIGIEQMDYIEDISVVRLQKVMAGHKVGVSESLNWKGGGSFVYMELRQVNPQLLHLIESAREPDDFMKAYDLIYKNAASLTAQADPEQLRTHRKSFELLPLPQKRKILIQLLDKNFLYLPFAELQDAEYPCSPGELAFNKSFYDT